MADQGVREIQLSGKQLVFLFMASVVLAVAIFLLGISVGRGVHGTAADGALVDGTTVATNDAPPPADMPAATVTTPADLSYHNQLQGQAAPAAQPGSAEAAPAGVPAEPPAPVDEGAAGSSASAETPKVAAPPPTPASRSAAVTSAATVRPPAAASAKVDKGDAPRAATSGWVLQVDTFRSKDNADRQVAQLKSKGYAAFALTAPGPLYRVRIGPFSQRADADRMAARLQREEGKKPLVTR